MAENEEDKLITEEKDNDGLFDIFGDKLSDQTKFWKEIIQSLREREYSKGLTDVTPPVDGEELKSTLFNIINTYCDFPYKQDSNEYSVLFDSLYNRAENDSLFWNRSVDKLIQDFKTKFEKMDDELQVGIGLKLSDLKKADAGFSFEKTPWVHPNQNNVKKKYDDVRLDKILDILNDEEDLQFTKEKYQKNGDTEKYKWLRLIMPQYSHRVEIEDLDRNFWVIAQVLSAISEWLFDNDSPLDSTIRSLLNEVAQLWENVLYLWLELALLTQKLTHEVRTIILYFPAHDFLTEKEYNDFELDQEKKPKKVPNFQDKVELIKERIDYLTDKYPYENLCVVPVIRWHNYKHNFYSTEVYTGLYLHAASKTGWEFVKFQEQVCSHEHYDTYPDLNEDGEINVDDATAVETAAKNIEQGQPHGLNKKQEYIADVNGDGKFTEKDAEIVLGYYNQIHVAGSEDEDSQKSWDRYYYAPDKIRGGQLAYVDDSIIISLEDVPNKTNLNFLTDYIYGLREVEDGYEYISPLSATKRIIENDQTVFYGSLRVIPRIHITYDNEFIWDADSVKFEIYDAVANAVLKQKNPKPIVTYSCLPKIPYPDLNKDGKVNLDDGDMIDEVVQSNLSGESPNLTQLQLALADVNKDGEITLEDSVLIQEYYTQVSFQNIEDSPESWLKFIREKVPNIQIDPISKDIIMVRDDFLTKQNSLNRAFIGFDQLVNNNPPYLGETISWWNKSRKVPELNPLGMSKDSIKGYLIKIGDFLPQCFDPDCYRWTREQKSSAGTASDYLMNYTISQPSSKDKEKFFDLRETNPEVFELYSTDEDNKTIYDKIVAELKNNNEHSIRAIAAAYEVNEDLVLDINWGIKRNEKKEKEVETFPLREPKNFTNIINNIKSINNSKKSAADRIKKYLDYKTNKIAQVYDVKGDDDGEGYTLSFNQIEVINLGWAKQKNSSVTYPLYNIYKDFFEGAYANAATYSVTRDSRNIDNHTKLFFYKQHKDNHDIIKFQEAIEWKKEKTGNAKETNIVPQDFIDAGFSSIEYYITTQYKKRGGLIDLIEPDSEEPEAEKDSNPLSRIMYFMSSVGAEPWGNNVSYVDQPQGTQGYWINGILLHLYRFISSEYRPYVKGQTYKTREVLDENGNSIGIVQYLGEINKQETFFKYERADDVFTRINYGRWRLPVLFPYSLLNEVFLFEDEKTKTKYYLQYGKLKQEHGSEGSTQEEPLLKACDDWLKASSEEDKKSKKEALNKAFKENFSRYYSNDTASQLGYLVSEEDITSEFLNIEVRGLWAVFDGNTSKAQKGSKTSVIQETPTSQHNLHIYHDITGEEDKTMSEAAETGFYFNPTTKQIEFETGNLNSRSPGFNRSPIMWTYKTSGSSYTYTPHDHHTNGTPISGNEIMIPITSSNSRISTDPNYKYYYRQNGNKSNS